ncbi:hypothetical protein L336_0367 [Candidatus Saccharimonas aalborgensis]|uniref:SpoVG family protein n=1 Tax=Candidatus Saccharimonas aalborgensis TaxID=1332188 RepID=R4PV52_9BACT|nr:hypothetical protein [Candidatus Saccharimonas aalborgensis]AGL62075.1 hypothetical protein L336_0367 [Candidatus Saccharimonas aalborgensis]
MENEFEVEAEVHKPVGAGYRVKVLIPDIGIYINGFMVFPPNGEQDWAVYPPLLGRAGRGKYRYTVEFNMQFPLWEEIRQACIEAVKSATGLSDEDDSTSNTQPTRKSDDMGFM